MDTGLRPQKSPIRKVVDSSVLSGFSVFNKVTISSSVGQCCNSLETPTKPDTLDVAGVIGKSRSKDTSNSSKIPRQHSSPVSNTAKKPYQITQLSIDGAGYFGSNIHKGHPSRSLSVPSQSSSSQLLPVCLKTEEITYSGSCSPTYEQKLLSRRNDDDRRSTSRSPVPRSKGATSRIVFPNRRSNLTSPSPSQCVSSSLCASNRSASLSPAPISRNRKNVFEQILVAPNHALSKNVNPDSNQESFSATSGSIGDIVHKNMHDNYIHRLSSASFRKIFSPIPSGYVSDQCFDGYHSSGIFQSQDSNDGVDSFTDGGHNFPAIKVEDCDENPLVAGLPGPNSKCYSNMKKSATTPDMTLGEIYERDQPTARQEMTSLNVPSPLVKWRTAEGRLIAAMNDDILTGALSRLRSRSEGNIPLALHDTDEPTHGVSYTDSITDHTQGTTSGLFSRYATNFSSGETIQPSRRSALRNTSTNECQVLTPTLHTEMISMSKLCLAPGPLATSVKRNVQFLSPQPRRKLGHKY